MKSIKYIFCLVSLMLLFVQTNNAQDYAVALKTPAVYSHYHLNPFLINPAHTGFDGKSSLIFNFRDHWAGFPDAPKGLTFGINGAPAHNMGLGGILYNENYGVANRFSGQINYAYHFKASDMAKFSLGLAGSYLQYSLDNEVYTDPLHQSPDPVINEALNGEKFFAADLGFWGEIANKYRLGISLPHLVETRLDNKKADSNEDKVLNFTAFLGAYYDVSDYRIRLEPSLGIRKISDVPFATDLNLLAKLLDDKLYGGFTYSFGPSWHRILFLAGVRIDKFKVYYSYDQSYLDFQKFNNGSHEVSLSFDLYSLKPKAKTENSMNEEKSEMH